jgi:hypothetical protein
MDRARLTPCFEMFSQNQVVPGELGKGCCPEGSVSGVDVSEYLVSKQRMPSWKCI